MDPNRTLFALTAETEAKRPDDPLIELLLGRSDIGFQATLSDARSDSARRYVGFDRQVAAPLQ
jgi:hypothetical protein